MKLRVTETRNIYPKRQTVVNEYEVATLEKGFDLITSLDPNIGAMIDDNDKTIGLVSAEGETLMTLDKFDFCERGNMQYEIEE